MYIYYKGDKKKIDLTHDTTESSLRNQITKEFGDIVSETKIKGINIAEPSNSPECISLQKFIQNFANEAVIDLESRNFELVVEYEFPIIPNKMSFSITVQDASSDSFNDNRNKLSESQKIPENESIFFSKQISDVKNNSLLKPDQDSSDDSSSDSYEMCSYKKKCSFAALSKSQTRENLEKDENKENISRENINLDLPKKVTQESPSMKKVGLDSGINLDIEKAYSEMIDSNLVKNISNTEKKNSSNQVNEVKVYTPLFEITDSDDDMQRLTQVKSALLFKVRKLSSIIVYLENIPYSLGNCSLFYTLVNPESVTKDVVCKYVEGVFKVELEMPDEDLLKQIASSKILSSDKEIERPVKMNFASINDRMLEEVNNLSRSLIKKTSMMSPPASKIKASPFVENRKLSESIKLKKYDKQNAYCSPALSGQNFTPQKKNSESKRLQKSSVKERSLKIKKSLGVESDTSDSSSNEENDDALTEEDTFSNSSDLETNNSKLNKSSSYAVQNDVTSELDSLLKEKDFIEIFKLLEKCCLFNKEKKNMCSKFVNQNQGIFDHLVGNCVKGRYDIQELTKKLELLSGVLDETKNVDSIVLGTYKKIKKKTLFKQIDPYQDMYLSAKMDSGKTNNKKKRFSFETSNVFSDKKPLKDISQVESEFDSINNEMSPKKAKMSIDSSSDSDDFEFQRKMQNPDENIWSEKKIDVGRKSYSICLNKSIIAEDLIVTREFDEKDTSKVINDFEDNSEEFIRKFISNNDNFLGVDNVVRGMAKCFASAKEENQFGSSEVSFNRTIKDFKYNLTIKKNIREIFTECLYKILGYRLELLEEYFNDSFVFKRILSEFGNNGGLTTVMTRIENLTRENESKLKLFEEVQQISALARENDTHAKTSAVTFKDIVDKNFCL